MKRPPEGGFFALRVVLLLDDDRERRRVVKRSAVGSAANDLVQSASWDYAGTSLSHMGLEVRSKIGGGSTTVDPGWKNNLSRP